MADGVGRWDRAVPPFGYCSEATPPAGPLLGTWPSGRAPEVEAEGAVVADAGGGGDQVDRADCRARAIIHRGLQRTHIL